MNSKELPILIVGLIIVLGFTFGPSSLIKFWLVLTLIYTFLGALYIATKMKD